MVGAWQPGLLASSASASTGTICCCYHVSMCCGKLIRSPRAPNGMPATGLPGQPSKWHPHAPALCFTLLPLSRRLRDLNDEINKLIREKGHWERRIVELGGPDYSKVGPKVGRTGGRSARAPGPGQQGAPPRHSQPRRCTGTGGMQRMLGMARDMPGSRTLLPVISCLTRHYCSPAAPGPCPELGCPAHGSSVRAEPAVHAFGVTAELSVLWPCR